MATFKAKIFLGKKLRPLLEKGARAVMQIEDIERGEALVELQLRDGITGDMLRETGPTSAYLRFEIAEVSGTVVELQREAAVSLPPRAAQGDEVLAQAEGRANDPGRTWQPIGPGQVSQDEGEHALSDLTGGSARADSAKPHECAVPQESSPLEGSLLEPMAAGARLEASPQQPVRAPAVEEPAPDVPRISQTESRVAGRKVVTSVDEFYQLLEGVDTTEVEAIESSHTGQMGRSEALKYDQKVGQTKIAKSMWVKNVAQGLLLLDDIDLTLRAGEVRDLSSVPAHRLKKSHGLYECLAKKPPLLVFLNPEEVERELRAYQRREKRQLDVNSTLDVYSSTDEAYDEMDRDSRRPRRRHASSRRPARVADRRRDFYDDDEYDDDEYDDDGYDDEEDGYDPAAVRAPRRYDRVKTMDVTGRERFRPEMLENVDIALAREEELGVNEPDDGPEVETHQRFQRPRAQRSRDSSSVPRVSRKSY